MRQELDQCGLLLFTGALEALIDSAEALGSIERDARGEIPVTGISLDIFPWHAAVSMSMRLRSDSLAGHRHDIGDWEYNDLSIWWTHNHFEEAGEYVRRFYEGGGDECRERAHLIFLAGAEALLDPRIGEQLQSFGIDAPIQTDHFGPDHVFEYIVFDGDGTVR